MDRFKSLESQIKSLEATIVANEMAADGVRKENEVGSRTLLDVLDAEQDLLQEKVEIIKVKREKFETIFSLIAEMGILSPQELGLDVKLYEYDESYKSVKNMWLGFEQ